MSSLSSGVTKRWLLRVVVASVVAGVAVAALAAPVARLARLVPDWANPFTGQTVDRSQPPVLLSLRDLADYHAASATFQAVIDVEHDTAHVPILLAGERTTFLGTGTVDAVVDFTHLSGAAVQVGADRRTVAVTVAAPQLAPAVVDVHASRVVGRERGLFTRLTDVVADDLTSDAQLYQRAQAQLGAAAAASDLTQRAQVNTRQMLTGLLGSLGFTHVTVTFDHDRR